MLFLFTVIQPQYRMDRDRYHGFRLQHGGNLSDDGFPLQEISLQKISDRVEFYFNNCKYRFDRNAVDHWEDRRDSRYLLWNGIDRGRCVYRYGLYFSAGALSEKTKSIILYEGDFI